MSAAPRRADSVQALPKRARRATRDLLLSLADSKRILGLRYSDWILGAPELEAGIAASSMAQDEWGHARILYALLEEFGDDPQAIEHGRPPPEYRSIEALDAPIENWPDFVAANALVDTALTVMLESIAEGGFTPIASRLRKQIEEERFHFAHGIAWLRRLAGPDATPASRKAVGAAMRRVWPTVLLWLGPPDPPGGAALVEAGVLARAGDLLRQRFLDRLGPALSACRLRLVSRADDGWTTKTKLSWSQWDESTRRVSRAGPDEETVGRARGDKNRIFLMD